MCVYIYIYIMYMCVYVFRYVCIYVYIYIYICIYLFIHEDIELATSREALALPDALPGAVSCLGLLRKGDSQ